MLKLKIFLVALLLSLDICFADPVQEALPGAASIDPSQGQVMKVQIIESDNLKPDLNSKIKNTDNKNTDNKKTEDKKTETMKTTEPIEEVEPTEAAIPSENHIPIIKNEINVPKKTFGDKLFDFFLYLLGVLLGASIAYFTAMKGINKTIENNKILSEKSIKENYDLAEKSIKANYDLTKKSFAKNFELAEENYKNNLKLYETEIKDKKNETLLSLYFEILGNVKTLRYQFQEYDNKLDNYNVLLTKFLHFTPLSFNTYKPYIEVFYKRNGLDDDKIITLLESLKQSIRVHDSQWKLASYTGEYYPMLLELALSAFVDITEKHLEILHIFNNLDDPIGQETPYKKYLGEDKGIQDLRNILEKYKLKRCSFCKAQISKKRMLCPICNSKQEDVLI